MRVIFDSLPDAAIVLEADHPNYTIRYVNNRHLLFTDKTREAIIGKSVFEVFPENKNTPESIDRDVLIESYLRVIDSGKPDRLPMIRYDLMNSEGNFEPRYWEPVHSPLLDDSGKVTHILQTVNDVTEQVIAEKDSEEALHEYDTLLQQTENLADMGSWSYDLETKKVVWSEGVYRICGVDPDYFDLNFETAISVIHPDDRDKATEAMKRVIQQGGEYKVQKRFIRSDGSIRHVMSRGNILKGDTGKPEKLVGVFHDVTEAEKVKAELKRSKRFYETLVKSVDGIVWEADADTFEFKYISPQLERILGYSADEWCSVPGFWESKIAEEDRIKAIEFCKKETQAGRDHTFEYRMFNADGEIVWIRDKVSVVVLESGKRLLRGLMLDITDQKKQEEKLQKSEARLKGIIESPTNYLIRIDIEGYYTFFNQKYMQDFGWVHGVDDLTGVHYKKSVMPYHREVIESVGQNAVKNPNKVFQVELDKMTRSGGVKTTLWSMHCITDGDNNPTEIQCMGIDITERKRAMELLELNERKYKSMVQDGSDIIAILDDLGNYNYVSPSVDRVLGYKPSELIEQNCMSYIHPDDQDRFVEIIQKLPGKKRFTIDPYRFKAADGRWLWLETSVTNLMDDPAVHGVIANSRDITRQVEREEQVRSSLDEKKVLLAEIHHRVKNNLAVVSSMMQLQAYEETDIEMERKLYDSMSRIKTMATIHELLYKSQSFSKLNFPEMVEQLIHSIDETFSRDTEVDIQIDTPAVELNINQAIPCSLIINEIITNIYKHAFEGRQRGQIQTSITVDGDLLTLLIEDDGVGFKPKIEPEKSSSLGMQLIRVLSQQLGGTFSFDSTGSGVTFKLMFERSEITGISTQGVTDT